MILKDTTKKERHEWRSGWCGEVPGMGVVGVWQSFLGRQLRIWQVRRLGAEPSLADVLAMGSRAFAIAEGVDFSGISPMAIAGILYIVLFPSICSFVFWNVSVRAVGASKAGITLNLIPVFTAMFSVIMGESIT